ncbi:homocysteine S-methyltransferase [Salsuginibacillus halophilus]|uniref:Homocysteine S-methyltransferase n=1 Tax=Salsuginibacillus halophilus TaxID=517424 RepID=A0A2P8HW55_9BACI|nr:bifunctional homocysteine S-methyltransferase/methylenetetrahydrofolate reductase [Salsuginibacillus halophilus]PSL50471.1 homocysteine S-methyltransferase [Salsuginibacillus halophilus]
MKSLKEALNEQVLVGDGAMGTLLYERGCEGSFEALNVNRPLDVQAVHEAYVEAGADVLQTNTYAANRVKLEKHGLEDEVKSMNRQGVKIAKTAADGQAYVLGTIGGIYGLSRADVSEVEVEQAHREQVNVLLNEGVDGLLLETFYDLKEAENVVKAVREQSELPVIAQVSLGDVGVMKGGLPLEDALKRLEAAGADVVGVNCRMGPYHILRSFETLPILQNAHFSAYPNASLPDYEDGRFVYQSNPSYFYERALDFHKQGVRLIGGCCGTRPEHVKAISDAVKGATPVTEKSVVPTVPEPAGTSAVSTAESLPEKVKREPTVIVELDPPKKPASLNKFLRGAEALHQAGADAVTLADNSLATPRVDNLAVGSMIQKETNARPLLHVACRDRNLIGQQSHLLGLHALGVQDVLAVTGDPTKVGDFPGAASVYDLTSFDLISMMKEMNEGRSYSGKSLGEKTNFTIAAAFNPNVRGLERAVTRLEKKIEAGADYFMTQPVYQKEKFADIYEATKHLSTPFFMGIMPLVNSRNAEFLHNEVPGIKLTDEVREQMAACGEDREKSAETGLQLAKDLIDEALKYFNGVYLITPFLRYELTEELTRYIKETQAGRKDVTS